LKKQENNFHVFRDEALSVIIQADRASSSFSRFIAFYFFCEVLFIALLKVRKFAPTNSRKGHADYWWRSKSRLGDLPSRDHKPYQTNIMIGTTTHGRTATFTLTDAQLGNIMTLFEPIIDDFLERLSQRVRELQDAARPRFYSRREAADLLHVSLPTIHAMVKAGALVPKKIGARVLFDAALIDAGIADGSLQKAVWTKKRRA